MNLINNQLEESLKAGYINRSLPSSKTYLPQFLVNDKREGKKILSTIIQCLNNCDEFWFSVAFVTTSGVATLIETLISLEQKGIKGKILVSQYLNFTQPEALKRLMQFKNIEIKIAIDDAFHSKGYLFKKNDVYDLIIGSSNLTSSALCSNIEWNLKVTATPLSHIIFSAINEFTTEYQKAVFVDSLFISNYEILYKKQIDYSNLVKKELLISDQKEIIPNSMQVEALNNIESLRHQGKSKALLISATGTGKTFLSAFDVKKYNPKKFLFVVHRLNIAITSMNAYKKIFGNAKKMGIYSGSQKDSESEFIFSTIQTISKEDNLKQFNPEHFDYIVVDETHRAGADSYVKMLDYFKPKFLLGMTATPERTDGLDIFKLFDYNIAYEIRLHRALDENILCPFHYYGVIDITVNGNLLEDNSEFNLLTSAERIERIIEKAKIYGCDNGKVRGLIFCSSVQECRALSNGFNLRGFNTIALSGASSEEERAQAILQLESDSFDLDYIFTVDIFNEGIDIPSINQIIMLRPTQSAIVFVQQLGRGLRKLENKDYLTVIDFIGNYKNNFLVPIALYGDTSYNKDSIRKLMASGSSLIPGTSTINFDKIAREKIFDAIDAANMQLRKDLVNDYNLLKFKLGRIPMMIDFIEHGSRDPFLFVSHSKSYFNFVKSLESSFIGLLNDDEVKLLELFSMEVNNSKRVEESLILHNLIIHNKVKISDIKEVIKKEFDYSVSDETIASCMVNLNFNFIRKSKLIAFRKGEYILIDKDLENSLRNLTFRKYLLDNVDFSIAVFRRQYNRVNYVGGIIRYNKYSRKDVCRVLNWSLDFTSTIFGYRTLNSITPCFVTYHKSDDISQTTNYNDHFIDQHVFAWESRSNRKIDSSEIQNLINSERILLFIKRENAEGSDFYFIGNVKIIEDSIEQAVMPGSNMPIVYFKFKLDQPVIDSIYEYLTSKSESNQIINIDNKTLDNEIKQLPFRFLHEQDVKPFMNCIPLINIKVAAGGFSDIQEITDVKWIELYKSFNYSNDYFVCQVLGESMNKIIPNGSWCLFKKDTGGSRIGKVVLVQHANINDSDFGKGYTVKLYDSQKTAVEDNWRHDLILLKPQSFDSEYKSIVLLNDESRDLTVRGIFVEVLN